MKVKTLKKVKDFLDKPYNGDNVRYIKIDPDGYERVVTWEIASDLEIVCSFLEGDILVFYCRSEF